MEIAYTARGKTGDGRLIRGNVIINSKADISAVGNIRYTILAYQFICQGLMYCSCRANAGYILFKAGQTAGTVVIANAIWSIGAWNNAGSGAWFDHVDDSSYMPMVDDYKYLPPRIGLSCDMVQGGPFYPVGRMELIWDPQFLCMQSLPIRRRLAEHGKGMIKIGQKTKSLKALR